MIKLIRIVFFSRSNIRSIRSTDLFAKTESLAMWTVLFIWAIFSTTTNNHNDNDYDDDDNNDNFIVMTIFHPLHIVEKELHGLSRYGVRGKRKIIIHLAHWYEKKKRTMNITLEWNVRDSR